MPEIRRASVEIRPFAAADRPFLASVAQWLHPGETASPRNVEAVARFFDELPSERLLFEPGAEAFVATLDGAPGGVVAVHPDSDYFTGHQRAHVDILVVSSDAEGQGVGRALMQCVEGWARQHGCSEVVLDVFAGNAGAIAFYERSGYQEDHIRMAMPLD